MQAVYAWFEETEYCKQARPQIDAFLAKHSKNSANTDCGETILNGLKPYLQVITVGSATCGKPFSMSPIEFGENTLMPVTARVLNARGEGDFIKGFRPDCKVKDDPTHLLGDPQEGMLKTAITFIDTGLCQASR